MKHSQFLTVVFFALLLTLGGCGSSQNEEYEQKVDLTDAQQATIEAEKANYPEPGVQPGGASGGGGGDTQPGALSVPGKSGG